MVKENLGSKKSNFFNLLIKIISKLTKFYRKSIFEEEVWIP